MNEHFFKTLKIENFRGIKSLEINDLARVNLFVGKNNCGKTSVLEAAFSLAAISDPNLMIRMQDWRGVVVKESSDIRDFFYNREYTKGATLSCTQVKGKRNLEISPLYDNLQMEQTSNVHSKVSENGGVGGASKFNAGSSAAGQSVVGIKHKFMVSDPATEKNRSYGTTTQLPKSGKSVYSSTLDENYQESMKTWFLFSHGYNHNSVDNMLNEKKKDVLLSALKSFDPKIVDIKTGSNNLVSVDIGIDRYIPINLLGYGVTRILNILSGIDATTPRGVLTIDEIENGLHVTALEKTWEVILGQSEKSSTQIFITTHSSDVLKSLRNVLSEILFSDAVACYRLVKHTDDKTRAYRYSSEELEQALSSDTDIRI